MSDTTITTDEATEVIVNKPVTLEKDSAEENAVSEKHATVLFKLFDESKTVMTRAEKSYRAWLEGASFRKVAHRMSILAAQQAFPDASPEEVDRLANTPSNKGGTKFVHTKLFTYAKAWQTVADAQLEPGLENVRRAFTVASTGGTADRLKALVEHVQTLNEADRNAAFMTGARLILDGKANQSSEGRPNDGTSKVNVVEAVDKIETMTIEVATSLIKSIAKHSWTGENADALLVAVRALEASVLGVDA